MHLLGDISAKRENFFEAAGVLAELRSCLARAFETVALLREKVCASHPPTSPSPQSPSPQTPAPPPGLYVRAHSNHLEGFLTVHLICRSSIVIGEHSSPQ